MTDPNAQLLSAALLFCLGIPGGLVFDLCMRVWYRSGLFGKTVCDLICLLCSIGLLLIGTLCAAKGSMRFYFILFFAAGAAASAWGFWPLIFRKRKSDSD